MWIPVNQVKLTGYFSLQYYSLIFIHTYKLLLVILMIDSCVLLFHSLSFYRHLLYLPKPTLSNNDQSLNACFSYSHPLISCLFSNLAQMNLMTHIKLQCLKSHQINFPSYFLFSFFYFFSHIFSSWLNQCSFC